MARGKIKPDQECKLLHVGIRMTAAEKALLERAAAAEKTTASDLARRGLANVLGEYMRQAESVTEGA